MKLINSPAFVRAAKKMCRANPAIEKDIEIALTLLQVDLFHPKLGTHKLKGNRSDVWSCKVAYDARILFHIIDDGCEKAILLLAVGTHDDVY